jgi:hypothetical protein
MKMSVYVYMNKSQHNVQNIAPCSIYLTIMGMLITAYTTMRGEHDTRKNTTYYM